MPLSPELEAYLPRFIQIESGGNPNARTGSYSGLLQMGPDEIAKYGGNGLEQGKQLLADRADELGRTLGRDPTPTELYLAHQQGMGGAQAHLANPDAPAWQNMAGTAEGRRRGEGWAKQAIWGNVPDTLKAQYPGGVDSLTSRQFVDLWRSKVERTPMAAPLGAPQAPMTQASPPVPVSSQPTPGYAPAQNNAPAGISGAQPGSQQDQSAPLMAAQSQMAPPDIPQMPQLGVPRRPPDLTQLRAFLQRTPALAGFRFSRG